MLGQTEEDCNAAIYFYASEFWRKRQTANISAVSGLFIASDATDKILEVIFGNSDIKT